MKGPLAAAERQLSRIGMWPLHAFDGHGRLTKRRGARSARVISNNAPEGVRAASIKMGAQNSMAASWE